MSARPQKSKREHKSKEPSKDKDLHPYMSSAKAKTTRTNKEKGKKA